MARLRRAGRKVIAIYGDSWFELTFRTMAGAIEALPKRSPPAVVQYGPIPLVPETSAEYPPYRGRADGVLVYGTTTGDAHAFADWLRRADVPTVVMLSEFVDAGLPVVCMDYHELGRIAARHLAVDCGCKSFLHIGPRGRRSTARREEGFRDALAGHGHEMHSCPVDVVDDTTERVAKPLADPGFESLVQSLARPIGLFANTDWLASAAAQACVGLGLRIPRDVAVLGVNNTMLAHIHSPSLSSIRVREANVGAVAMRLLTDLMCGGKPPPGPVLVGGSELYCRASTVGPQERTTVFAVDVAMEHIQASACSGLTVERLAEVLGVSRRRLEELFRQERGTSPNEEIQRVRFEKAALLLRSTTHSVTQITHLTGFGFPSGFCKFFQRKIGMTPLEYRASHARA